MPSSPDNADDLNARLHAERQRVRDEMGGRDRMEAIRAAGGLTARDWIGGLVDADSFQEIGTLARAEAHHDRRTTPGDGRIAGHAAVAGRPVSVAADDITVKAGTDAESGRRRVDRVFSQAIQFGNPFIYFGQSAGSRIPDILGSEKMSTSTGVGLVLTRARQVPMATVIVGRSYGESSFFSALSDLVVQMRGSVLAVTSPRVIEIATGETITEEELGGATIHARTTGQVDVVAETPEAALTAVKRFLSYLPDHARQAPPRREGPARGLAPGLRGLVPAERRRGYDMRKVLRQLLDDGAWFELGADFGKSLITGLARLNGHAVGILASQPMQQGGAMTPEACDKAVRLLCLCDAFSLPVIFLADTPGFLVGRHVEQQRLLSRAIKLSVALSSMRVPRLSVVIRKAYGLAYFNMSGGDTGSVLHVGWPTADISFMDPEVAANVLHGGRLAGLDAEAKAAETERIVADLSRNTGGWDAATVMGLDELIDPAETPVILGLALDRAMAAYDPTARPSVLAHWPTSI